MNGFMWTLLLLYLLVAAVEYGLQALNIRHLREKGGQVPEEFRGEVDQAQLTRSRDYTLAKNRLSLISSLFGHALVLVFIFGGLLDWYNTWVASWQLPFVLSGLVFFLLLVYAQTLTQLPFSWYRQFRLEARFGFNTQTWRLWLLDIIKSLFLSTLLLGVLLGLGLWLIKVQPAIWWLWIWIFFLVYSLFVMYISPYVLEPLFNKFTPLEQEGLTERITEVMKKAGIMVKRVFTMDASRRSRHTNAYFTGLGRVKRIVLYDTLLQKMSESEIVAVLAHEIGHWKKKHVLKRLVVTELFSLVLIYTAFRILQSDWLVAAFQVQTATWLVKLALFGFLASIALFPVGPLSALWSRRHEREADKFAAELTRDPGSLGQALVKLAKDNLSNLHPHPWYAAFYYSHPPIRERLKTLQKPADSA